MAGVSGNGSRVRKAYGSRPPVRRSRDPRAEQAIAASESSVDTAVAFPFLVVDGLGPLASHERTGAGACVVEECGARDETDVCEFDG